MKSPQGWKRPFDDAIPLTRGRSLVTLENAGPYITKLPKAVHEAKEWQAAMEALILVATLGGPTMFARIGVMRALNRHVERVIDPSRKDEHHGGRRSRARDQRNKSRHSIHRALHERRSLRYHTQIRISLRLACSDEIHVYNYRLRLALPRCQDSCRDGTCP